jgi:hypothetical protein
MAIWLCNNMATLARGWLCCCQEQMSVTELTQARTGREYSTEGQHEMCLIGLSGLASTARPDRYGSAELRV